MFIYSRPLMDKKNGNMHVQSCEFGPKVRVLVQEERACTIVNQSFKEDLPVPIKGLYFCSWRSMSNVANKVKPIVDATDIDKVRLIIVDVFE
jgi:hypothetical protein